MSESAYKQPIGPDSKVGELIKAYPFLIDVLADLAPAFKKLKNPVLRGTIAKVATLKMAAVMGNIPLQELIDTVAAAVREQTEETPEVAAAEDTDLDRDKLDTLKGVILSLHAGEEVEDAKKRFEELVQDVSATEIAQMEQQLIAEGLPADQIKSLCDVHVAVFQDNLDGKNMPEFTPGHPIHTFLIENKAILEVERELQGLLAEAEDAPDPVRHGDLWGRFTEQVDRLQEVEKHYQRKEHLLFPVLEKLDFSGPSQVMWALHDDAREELKRTRKALEQGDGVLLADALPKALQIIRDMINKEESILFPTAIDMLEHEDWAAIRKGEDEFGYTLVEPENEWNPRIKIGSPQPGDPNKATVTQQQEDSGGSMDTEKLKLIVGEVTLEQINLMFLHLPVEVTYVDENDEVRYFTGHEKKLFGRPANVIGRKVQNCHPPKSLHLVDRIVKEFRKGTRDVAEFWMDDFKGKFIHIQYFAVRDKDGNYRGALETVQDVTEIRKLEGQRRLLDEEG